MIETNYYCDGCGEKFPENSGFKLMMMYPNLMDPNTKIEKKDLCGECTGKTLQFLESLKSHIDNKQEA